MNNQQLHILNLEKKYMDILSNIFYSENFCSDLKRIESYIQNNYNYISDTYNKKNKIDIAIERLIRFYIYKNINVFGIYPSPISCDMAIETQDCILNIDSKTIDSIGNKTDINYFHFESNQSSFINNNFGSQANFTGIPVNSYLPPIDPLTNKPILTYFLKVIYSDNGRQFKFYNEGDNLHLTCLPNGILSPLFNNNIVFNFKTYTYDTNNIYYICSKSDAQSMQINFEKTYSDSNQFLRELALLGFNIPFSSYNIGNINGRPTIIVNNEAYVPVKRGNVNFFLEKLICGHTARVLYNTLTYRVDGNGYVWFGHLTKTI